MDARASTNQENVSKWFLFQKEFGQVLIGDEGSRDDVGCREQNPWRWRIKRMLTLLHPRVLLCGAHHICRNCTGSLCSLLDVKPHAGRDHACHVQCHILTQSLRNNMGMSNR